MNNAPQYLLVINYAPTSLTSEILELRKRAGFANLTLLVLTETPCRYDNEAFASVRSRIIPCRFESDESIAAAIAPYREAISGIVCRGDKYIQDLRRVIPFLPESVLVSTPESLRAATNKRLMRTDFMQHYPEVTPHFIEVHDDAPTTIEKVEAHLNYPVIVKPANLASSLLIQSCSNRAALQRALTKSFARIQEIYHIEGRRDKPQVIVEEYLEGNFYSIDAYVMAPGELYCCPPIAYIPAKQLGIDDFFLYKRFAPSGLNVSETAAANETAAKAIMSIGLTHTAVHVELIRTAYSWKVIELGPRLGRFRKSMYRWSYGINHSLNDMLIHVGQKPHIRSKLLEYSAAYSVYPKKEGVLRRIEGLEYLRQHPLVRFMQVRSEPGKHALFAKHGGHALAEFVIASADKHAFDKLVTFVEENVEAIID